MRVAFVDSGFVIVIFCQKIRFLSRVLFIFGFALYGCMCVCDWGDCVGLVGQLDWDLLPERGFDVGVMLKRILGYAK